MDFIDTATLYGGGANEEIVGAALHDRRDEIIGPAQAHGAEAHDPHLIAGRGEAHLSHAHPLSHPCRKVFEQRRTTTAPLPARMRKRMSMRQVSFPATGDQVGVGSYSGPMSCDEIWTIGHWVCEQGVFLEALDSAGTCSQTQCPMVQISSQLMGPL
jgi:hypothetical protein